MAAIARRWSLTRVHVVGVPGSASIERMPRIGWKPIRFDPAGIASRLDLLLVLVVAGLAERLPVGAPPEQLMVATVGLDMVDDGGGVELAALLAGCAKRMGGEEGAPGAIPLAVISSLTG